MLNETMVKLAEKGIVPPAEALQAVGGSTVAAALSSLPPTTPLYEQAKARAQARRMVRPAQGRPDGSLRPRARALLVDRRGSANGFGLVLLFVGIGYVVLWYFEDRQSRARAAGERHDRRGVSDRRADHLSQARWRRRRSRTPS